MINSVLLTAVLGYVIGSIPFGLLISNMHGKDIRKSGSGNIGATNTLRLLGPVWGLTVFVLDIGKGFAGCAVGALTAEIVGGSGQYLGNPVVVWAVALGGLTAIAGHNWSLFLGFDGGKGAATTTGAFLYMSPVVVVVGLTTALVVAAVSKYMSLGSLSGMTAGVIISWFLDVPNIFRIAMLVALAWGLWRHQGNIKRLLRGEERKLGSDKKNGSSGGGH